MATLNETLKKFSNRIRYAESFYAKKNAGATLDTDRKIVLAQVLNNTSKFLSESFDNTVQTQRSDIGLFKRFAMDITTLVMPNLVAPEMVLVKPMDAMHGYITYFTYVRGSNKGASKQGDLITSPFALGKAEPNYTSSTVIENHTEAASATEINLKWCPVVPGSIAFTIGDDNYFDGGDGILYQGTFASKVFQGEALGEDGRLEGRAGRFVVDHGAATPVGTVQYGYVNSKSVTGAIYDANQKAKITFTASPFAAETLVTVNYLYNNVAIMQEDIPTVTAVNKGIYLMAKARRVAITYSQMAAYQAKQEYGNDLGKSLEKVAIGTLKWDIDTEITTRLYQEAADAVTALGLQPFNVTPRVGVSLSQHLEGFVFYLNLLKTFIYEKTQRFFPTYMLCGTDVWNILKFVKGWKGNNAKSVNGPFVAGDLDELKVIVSPNVGKKDFVLGVNDGDFETSAAVYAPYMAIVPTALLETPDGANAQGFSTLYAFEMLNKDLLIKGAIAMDTQTITLTA